MADIDQLVDGASSSVLLSFMDAYLGYNYIKMHPQDETKTTFITDAWAYCYKVMPFGLKNAEATYQRLMDWIFEGLIGGDVEVFMDDMVVKSAIAADHYKDLGRPPPPNIDETNTQVPLLIYISVAEEAASIGTGERRKTTPYILRRRKKVPEDREGDPHPSDRISKIVTLLSRALDNCKDGPANQAGTQETGLGRADGDMERPTF
ncbi:hypothetical protein CR513_30687, partial [Mucuna pruriens]